MNTERPKHLLSPTALEASKHWNAPTPLDPEALHAWLWGLLGEEEFAPAGVNPLLEHKGYSPEAVWRLLRDKGLAQPDPSGFWRLRPPREAGRALHGRAPLDEGVARVPDPGVPALEPEEEEGEEEGHEPRPVAEDEEEGESPDGPKEEEVPSLGAEEEGHVHLGDLQDLVPTEKPPLREKGFVPPG